MRYQTIVTISHPKDNTQTMAPMTMAMRVMGKLPILIPDKFTLIKNMIY